MGRESNSRSQGGGEPAANLFDLFNFIVIDRWKHLCVVAAAAFMLGYLATFLMTPVYESEIALLVLKDDSTPQGLGGDIGALAALAGLSLGASGQRQQEAVALLTSNDVAIQFVNDHSLLPELFPIRWKLHGGDWGADGPPSEEEIAKAFRESMLHVGVNPDNGLTIVSLAAPTPETAVSRVREYVQLVDNRLRERTISESTATLEVLQRELKDAATVEIRTAISNLMESTMRDKTFANVKREFAYRVIDRPLLTNPNNPARPQRLITAIASALSFTVLAILVFAWSHRALLRRA